MQATRCRKTSNDIGKYFVFFRENSLLSSALSNSKVQFSSTIELFQAILMYVSLQRSQSASSFLRPKHSFGTNSSSYGFFDKKTPCCLVAPHRTDKNRIVEHFNSTIEFDTSTKFDLDQIHLVIVHISDEI